METIKNDEVYGGACTTYVMPIPFLLNKAQATSELDCCSSY